MVNKGRISIGKCGGYVGIMWDYVGLCGVFCVNEYKIGFGFGLAIWLKVLLKMLKELDFTVENYVERF